MQQLVSIVNGSGPAFTEGGRAISTSVAAGITAAGGSISNALAVGVSNATPAATEAARGVSNAISSTIASMGSPQVTVGVGVSSSSLYAALAEISAFFASHPVQGSVGVGFTGDGGRRVVAGDGRYMGGGSTTVVNVNAGAFMGTPAEARRFARFIQQYLASEGAR
jgi:hypothetical protein